eukprot:m.263477 g.263477  ORF g.263477 m.263477 type:complete len:353 (-) comp50560_c0_seq1:209-1267(-)
MSDPKCPVAAAPTQTGLAKIPGFKKGVEFGSIDIYWWSWGQKGNPAVLFISGLGSHGHWGALNSELASRLVAQGYYVIGMDNRDIGLSSRFDDHPDCVGPPAGKLVKNLFGFRGSEKTVGFTLDDMARDCVELLNVLDVKNCHIVGHSMGGMIVQLVCINHPTRVLSLTISSSSSNAPGVSSKSPGPHLGFLVKMARQAPKPIIYTDEAFAPWIEKQMQAFDNGAKCEPHFPYDRDREMFSTMFKEQLKRVRHIPLREDGPDGPARHVNAILSSYDRAPLLATVTQLNKIPVLITHGEDDPIMPVKNGLTTHYAIPDSKLFVFKHVKHQVPLALFDKYASLLLENFSKAVST